MKAKQVKQPKMKPSHKHLQGICPCCGKENLDYGNHELSNDDLGYEFDCPDCGFCGVEWYKLTFIEHTER